MTIVTRTSPVRDYDQDDQKRAVDHNDERAKGKGHGLQYERVDIEELCSTLQRLKGT
jgi:hypothetical protein